MPHTELGPAARAGVWRLGPPAGVGCRPRQERSGGSRTPHLGLLRGVGEGQRVDAAGGQARLERFGAVSENDLLALGREGVLSCLKKRRRALRRGPEREPRLLRGAALRRARRVGSLAVRRAGLPAFRPAREVALSADTNPRRRFPGSPHFLLFITNYT